MYISVHTICDVNSVYVVKTRDAKVSLDEEKNARGKKEGERDSREILGSLLLSDITPYKE